MLVPIPIGSQMDMSAQPACTYKEPHAVPAVDHDTASDGTYVYDKNGNMTCRIEGGDVFIQGYNADREAPRAYSEGKPHLYDRKVRQR